MKNLKKWEIVAGLILFFSPAKEVIATDITLPSENEVQVDVAYLHSPNILEVMIQDGEQVVPPTPVNGSYLAGFVVHQNVQANWVQSDVGIQLFHEWERLDPRRYQVEWRVVVHPYSVAKARFIESDGIDFSQKIQIEAPLNSLNGQLIGAIVIEVRISDREQPEKAPEVIVQTLSELIANGRDGL